jgi:hypothetical protein
MVVVEPVVHGVCIHPEGERARVNQRLVVLRPVGDGVKRLAHDADLKGMVVIRSPHFQLVTFKPHRFWKRPCQPTRVKRLTFISWGREPNNPCAARRVGLKIPLSIRKVQMVRSV